MKVCILTLWNSDNYGAYLQAFALMTLLKNKGCDVYFYDFTKKRKRPFPYISRRIETIPYFYKLYRGYEKAQGQFNLCNKNFKCDGVIIGSDELWNVKNNSFVHYEEYLGYGLNSVNIVTYAVSCNGCTREQFESSYPTKNLSNIKHLSARDDSTLKLFLEYSVEGTKVLDPTFLLESYEKYEIECDYGDYILIYGYNYTDDEIIKIKHAAKQFSLKLLSCGAYLNWTDLQIPASPFEFLGLVKNARFVITSTFHGTVFSVIYRKNFVSIARNNLKIKELLQMFFLTERDVTGVNDYCEKLNKPIDYSIFESVYNNLKKCSLQYLDSFLLEAKHDSGN